MKSVMKKLEALAEEYGWEMTIDEPHFTISREGAADGYPYMIMGSVDGRTVIDGLIVNDYGSGPESFKVGIRYMSAVLANVENPLRYKVFLDAFNVSDPTERSEKVLALKAGITERQVRKARICGFIEPNILDDMCYRILGQHPASLYGFDAWVDGVAIDFTNEDIDEWQKEGV